MSDARAAAIRTFGQAAVERMAGRPGQIRTADLTLIRGAL